VSLNVKKTASADIVILDDADQVAEIRDLKLTSARFRAGGSALIGETYPLFLFWMQYAHHEDPERNCGSGGKIEVVSQTPDQVVLTCEGTTASGECASTMVLTIRRLLDPTRYVYHVDASLDVRSDQGWLVTPNPSQGEVEFANLWPSGTFSPNPKDQKLYQACYHVSAAGVGRIPHHHVETSDKHNIAMSAGDKFLWIPHEENPCLTILSAETVTAGVCAYMWDAHFAYKICIEGKDVILPAGAHFEASYELGSIDEKEAESIIDKAVDKPAPELATIPLYVPGVNHFTRTLQNIGRDWRYVWPWETEGDAVSTPVFDLAYGFDDTSCLRIDSTGNGKSCWKVTTLGPAFGGKPFVDGAQYQLSAIMKTMKLEGKSMIALRLHRTGKGSEFDLQNYETFTSGLTLQGDADWRLVKVITPPVTPVPDRVHILLIQEGCGTTWFDDVFFEVLS
jgi:hypothetical protein